MFWMSRDPVNKAETIRLLNQPQPLTVEADDRGVPRRIGAGERQRRVVRIVDAWRIDDEWWRTTISRRYLLVVLEDGVVRTIFQNLVGSDWYEQTY